RQSRPAGIKGGDVSCAVQEAKRIVTRIDRAGFELKWASMGKPAGDRGPEFKAQIFAGVKISDAGPAAKPLKHSADGKVRFKLVNVERQSAGSLKYIEDHVSAYPMRFFNDGSGVDDERAAEKYE